MDCPNCGHSLINNEHGIDQNDFVLGEDNEYHLTGSCTYCRDCNPMFGIHAREV